MTSFALPSESRSSMAITDVQIALQDENKLKAFVTITFSDCFVVRGVKVISGNNGLFVAMPSRRKVDGSFQDIAHPTNRECREWIEDAVLKAYSEAVDRGDGEGAGKGAKLIPPPPSLFGAARLILGSEEEA